MQKLSAILLLLIFSVALPYAGAQTGNDQQQSESMQTGNSAAAPAAGQEPTPPQASQFPPLSGLDEPALEPNVAARSFFVYGGQLSEFVDSNPSNSLGRGFPITGVTHVLGAAGLQRLWERYQLSLGYDGGESFYAGNIRRNAQVQQLSFTTRALWRTGALTIRDRASYLPDGSFGATFGDASGILGGGTLGGEVGGGLGGSQGNRFNFFGGNMFGAIGAFPVVENMAVIDLQQALSPRSAFTLATGYNLVHFTKSSGGLLIDSHEFSAQAGFDHSINRRNKIAAVYGFQHYQFPVVGSFGFVTHVMQLLYGYQISGRMDLLLGGGPQLTRLSSVTAGTTLRMTASARASLRYKFPRASMMVSYSRFNTAASGLFAGGTTDYAGLSYSRPLGRRWLAGAHAGYAHTRRLQVASVGVNAGSFQTGVAGLRLTRTFTRSLTGFVFYGFNDLQFDPSFCGSGTCNRTTSRHMGGIGISWHPHAIRLD